MFHKEKLINGALMALNNSNNNNNIFAYIALNTSAMSEFLSALHY